MTTPICLAFAGDLSNPSGGTDRITALASGLQNRGYEMTVVAPEPDGELPDRLKEPSVRTVDVGIGPISNASIRGWQVTRVAERIARQQGAILQVEHSTLAGIGSIHLDRPFVLDMHDLAHARFDHVNARGGPLLKWGISRIERRAIRKARHVIVVSGYMRDYIVQQWNCNPESVTVVSNGYFADRIRPYLDADPDPGRVSFLGTLHPKVHVETFARIADLSAVSEMVVMGDGAQRERVEQLAERYDALRATGRISDDEAFDLLARSSIAVNPQDPSELQRSSSPVKLYYYAALGRPMVVTEGPSIVQKLAESEALVTADPGPAFVEKVDDLLQNADRLKRLGDNARNAAESFEWARRVDKVADVHEGIQRSTEMSQSSSP